MSAADSQRYELEDRISSLEEQFCNGKLPPGTSPRSFSAVAEIDNEALRDQIHHLQRKVVSLEDALEDAHAATEREEVATRERVRRFREKEEVLRRDFNEGRKEVEQFQKLEANARRRVEETEDALRESTMALENARAELEVLRAECAVSSFSCFEENLFNRHPSKNTNGLRADDATSPRALGSSNEHAGLIQEISRLTKLLEDSRANERAVIQRLEISNDDRVVQEHRASLVERSVESEALKKRSNRNTPVNNGLEALKQPKPDLATAREEVTGLK